MRVYILSTDVKIEPFNDPAREMLFLDRTLAELQKDLFRRSGMEPVVVDDISEISDREYFLTRDNVFVSEFLWSKFRKGVMKVGRSVSLSLEKNSFTELTAFLQELPERIDDGRGSELVRYNLHYIKDPKNPADPTTSCEPLAVKPWLWTKTLKLSDEYETMPDLHVPITLDVIIEVGCWVHVWMANLFSLPLRWVEIVKGRPLRSVLRLLAARPLTAWDLRKAATHRGRGARIHPSAVVEGSILGDNVSIGANSTVTASYLGDGVRVQENSILLGSVVMKEGFVTKRGVCNFSVLYPGAQASTVQASFLGRKARAMGLARITDMKVRGTIPIVHRGELSDTGLNFLGGCLGHRSSLVGRVILAHGRALPNDLVIAQDPAGVITEIPQDLPTGRIYIFKDGELVPV